MWAYGDNNCGCLINGLSHSNWIMSLGIQRAWSCPGYRTVWNTLTHTHTHNVVFSSRSFLQINCLHDYCWESWRCDGNYGKMFFKGRKKKIQPPTIRSLLCSCCMREMAQMRSCYSTVFLQYSDATLPALYICSEDFWLLADPEKSFPHILLSATAWTAEMEHTYMRWWKNNIRPIQK